MRPILILSLLLSGIAVAVNPSTGWQIGKIDSAYRHAITAKPNAGTWHYIFSTKRHGDVDLDSLLDKLDSVLDGKRRPEKFDRCAEIMSCTALYCGDGSEDCNTCADRCCQAWRGGKRVTP
jgi:hypothetical protein